MTWAWRLSWRWALRWPPGESSPPFKRKDGLRILSRWTYILPKLMIFFSLSFANLTPPSCSPTPTTRRLAALWCPGSHFLRAAPPRACPPAACGSSSRQLPAGACWRWSVSS